MKRILMASELMSNAMSEQIDRIVEQESGRVRVSKHGMEQKGLEQWI